MFAFEVEAAGAEDEEEVKPVVPAKPAGPAEDPVEEELAWLAAAWRADERVTLDDMSKYVATGHLTHCRAEKGQRQQQWGGKLR